MFSSSLGVHEGDKLLVVNLSVPVSIGLPDQVLHLLLGQPPQAAHHLPQLRDRDQPVPVPVKDPEDLPDVLLAAGVLHLLGHHGEELGEVDSSAAVSVHLVDDVPELVLGLVLAQLGHGPGSP